MNTIGFRVYIQSTDDDIANFKLLTVGRDKDENEKVRGRGGRWRGGGEEEAEEEEGGEENNIKNK